MGGDGVSSIESMQVGSAEGWSIILESNAVIARTSPAIAAINDNEIAVYGGKSKDIRRLNSGYVFQTVTNEVRPILGSQTDFKFWSYTQT